MALAGQGKISDTHSRSRKPRKLAEPAQSAYLAKKDSAIATIQGVNG